jgi:prepilin-type N-terminal cleavage/methylation domain-containing protein
MIRNERGATLVELIVVLAILGIVGAVVGLAPRGIAALEPAPDAPAARVSEARRTAIATGTAVTATVLVDGVATDVTAWPDGSVQSNLPIPGAGAGAGQ